MTVATYKGTVENGQITFSEKIILPEHATVYVLVPDVEPTPQPTKRIRSPHLVDPKQSREFQKELVEVEDGTV